MVKIHDIVLNQGNCDNSSEDGTVSIAETVPIDCMVKMCDALSEGLEQSAFMSVYKITDNATLETIVNEADDKKRNNFLLLFFFLQTMQHSAPSSEYPLI